MSYTTVTNFEKLNNYEYFRHFCIIIIGIPKTLKMVLDTSLLNTQKYKVRIKGKVEQSRESSSTLPYTSV